MGSRFIAHDVALEAAVAVHAFIDDVPGKHKDLITQCRRAANSMALNLAEGAGRAGRDRLYHFRVAYGSARETATALGLLVRLGAAGPAGGADALDLVDRTCALTWRLMQATGR